MNFVFWLSLAVLCAGAFGAVFVSVGARRILRLEDVAAGLPAQPVKVSVIVAALNEADTIEPALRTLLALDYPNLEIIAINDRSTDATPAILEALARGDRRLRVIHIDSLPPGWLGKSHALHCGVQAASGDYLVFTDADVMFGASSVTRAVAYCEREQVDHLTLFFRVTARSALLNMLMISFTLAFLVRFQPWRVATSRTHFLGLGGFNMLRKPAYLKAGGHASIPMAVLDDMMLGKLMKTQGYRQHVLSAFESVSVEWYRSTPEMIRGLQKNIFSAFDYRLSQLLLISAGMLLLRVWPWIGLFAATGAARWINLATVAVMLTLYAVFAHARQASLRCLLFAPVICFVELAMWWKGSLLTVLRGGIDWRGTYYSLAELRQAHSGR